MHGLPSRGGTLDAVGYAGGDFVVWIPRVVPQSALGNLGKTDAVDSLT